jgi:hypothetical protein
VTTTCTTLGSTVALSVSIAPLRFLSALSPVSPDSARSARGSGGPAVAAEAASRHRRQAVAIRIEVIHFLRFIVLSI